MKNPGAWEGTGGAPWRRPATALAVAALVFSLSLLVRATDVPRVFHDGVAQIGPLDELYHAKRILYSAAHPGRVLSFDPNRGLRGGFCPWPPLYDVTAGFVSRILSGSAPTPNRILSRAVWIPPLVASLFAAAIAAWMALSRRGSPFDAFLAGTAVAFATLEGSRLADIDHHFLEPSLLFGVIGATALLGRARGRGDALRGGVILGAAVVACVLVQPALLLGAAVSALAILLLPRAAIAARWGAALGFGVAACGVAVYRWSLPSGYPSSSWFLGDPHAAALVAAAVACAVSAIALERGAGGPAAFLLAGVVGGLSSLALPPMIENLIGGAGFLAGDPWLRTIVEFQPLIRGWPDLWPALLKLGGGMLLLPFVIAAARRGGLRFVVLVFGLAYLVLSLLSRRFLICERPLLAILGALAVSGWKSNPLRAGAGAVILLAPTLWFDVGVVRDTPPAVSPETVPYLRAAGALGSSRSGPERVLPPWSWGHVFEVFGGQAPVVDGFGTSIGQTDFENALGVTLSANERHVADYCRANGIRYVVLENPVPRLLSQAATIGLPTSFFMTIGEGGQARILPLMRFSFWWRAYFDRGAPVKEPTRSAAAFRSFELVYADPTSTEILRGFPGPAVEVWRLRETEAQPGGSP